MPSSPKDVREQVREEYGRRVAKTSLAADEGPESGATERSCQATSRPKGLVADLAGYSSEELAHLPDEAVADSFGCGNPVALAGIQPGNTVLDLGCGAGMDLLLAARLVGPGGRAIGVDMTEEMLVKASANILAAGLDNVEVRHGIIEALPVDDASIDWVISNCVINLSPEKPRVFAEIERVLRPGGQMLISDMMARDLPKEVLDLPGAYASCVAGAIDEEAYLGGLRAAGMVGAEIRGRLVYSGDQLVAAALSQIDSDPNNLGLSEMVGRAVRNLEGRIWSSKVYARKPS